MQNIGGFTAKKNDPSDNSLRKWITEMGFDVFGIPSPDMYWKLVPQELQFMERVKYWWNPRETRASFAYNDKGISTLGSTRQHGGAAQISRGNAALKYQGSGKDPRGLGRWVWHQFRGTGNHTLRVITAYRPIKAKAKGGVFTVWAQHRRHFNRVGKKNVSPTQIILDDLALEIRKWKNEGEHVILMMDCNEDVQSPAMQDFLRKTDMIEAISDRHEGIPPRTYINGSKQIDGIFTTRSVSITAGGFAAFKDGVQGERADHRCLWINVRIETVLGHKMPGPTRYAGRRVKTQDVRIVKKFNAAYKQFAIEHKLAKKIYQLEKEVTFPMPAHLEEVAEKIAELRYQGLKYADKRCRRLFFGQVPFTPEYKRLSNAVKFWRFALKKKNGRKINSRHLQRLLKKASITTPLRAILAQDLQEIKHASYDAYKEYRSYLKRADVARDNWLDDLAKARAKEEMETDPLQEGARSRPPSKKKPKSLHKATSTELKKLKTQENVRRVFGRIKTAIGKETLAGISMVTAPDGVDEEGNTKWKEVSKHSEIVDALISTHHDKYHQTEDTPPMTGVLRHQLGYLGIGEQADKILEGKYEEKPGTNQYAALLLRNLQKIAPDAKDLPVGISGAEYSDGWKKAKERTSAGGSVLHFGHCKSIAHDPELSEMEAAFLSIPLRSGYAFKQWRKGIDCVLPKKANSFRVDKLRTIVLLEADFNFTNKFVSRKTAKRAEKNKGFAQEQFGSRKRHRAIDHAWNKQLTLDLLRQLKMAGVLVPNDLKSCYDRICHSIASICMQRQGVAKSEVVCMFATLQHLEHTIRCSYGDSEKTYGSDLWAIPMQGVYQGNGAGPVIWAVVSSPVLEIMREAGFGTFFKTAISGNDIRLVGYAFVDDTDLIQTARQQTDSIESVIREMQKGMDTWEGLIRATGGALSIDKCCWWAIDFTWRDDGTWRYKTKEEIIGNLHAVDFDGIRRPIKRFEINKAFETLGTFLAPDGNQDESYTKLLEKAKTWADRLRTAHLREQETATALKTTILKTLEYPLLTLHLSEDQCRAIMRPILESALPKAKFNRNFCRRTLFGPGSHLGVEIHNLHTSQLIEHAEGMLRHGPSDSLSGQLLRGSIEALKLELGLSGDLFSHSFKKVGLLATDCWVARTWKEMELAKIQITEQTPSLLPSRQHDVLIMDRLQAVGVSGVALQRLNRCRIRLQVNSLADMCSGDGSTCLPQFLSGNNPLIGSSDYQWPNQGPLDAIMWRTWSRRIRSAFRINRQGRLARPLGKWLPRSNKNWTAWHDPGAYRTLIKEGASWRQFQHQPRTLEGQDAPVEIHQTTGLPDGVLKAVAWIEGGQLIYHGSSRQHTPTQAAHPNLQQTVTNLETEWNWTLPYYRLPTDAEGLANKLAEGEAIAVADGSFKNQRGTAGFCITDCCGRNGFYGANDVPADDPTTHCSYRSELAGILGILILCKGLCHTFQLTQGKLCIGCDNLEAGRHALERDDPPRPTDNHFDLLSGIFRLRQELPISLSYRHVEGHQKEKYPTRPLDIWARLNDRMDAMAKAYWEEIADRPMISNLILMPDEWRVYIDNRRICNKFKINMRRHLEGRRLEEKWTSPTKRKRRVVAPLFSRTQINQIDFSVIQRAWGSIPGNRRRFVAKMASSSLPVGRNMLRMKFWPKSNCPCCLHPNETVPHMLLHCRDPRVQDNKRQALEGFSLHLERLKTAPRIRLALMALAQNALLGTPRQPELENDELRDAISSQLHIGLQHFIFGRISHHWAPLQHKAYSHFAPWLTGASWAKQVVVGLWEMAFNIWEYRNQILHHTEVLDTLLDMDTIDLEIIEEWHAGISGVPDLDRHLFRGLSLDLLLDKRSKYRREWLAAVRLAKDPGDPDSEEGRTMDDSSDRQPVNPSQSLPFSSDGRDASANDIHDTSSDSSVSSA